MKPFMEDNLAKEHSRDITRELTDIRLQEEALKNKASRSSLFTHTMQSLGQWLILRGENMVKRYEVPANSKKSSKQRYAH